MDLLLTCHEILYEMERQQLLDVFTEEQMLYKGQEVRGVGAFMYDEVLLLNKEAKPIISLMISEQGEMIVPGSTNTYFEQLIEDYGLKKEDFTVTFLEKLHGFGLNTFHTLSLEDTEWSPKRHRWKFAENFDSVMRGRATWRPSLECKLSAGWIVASSSVFGDRFFMNSEMQLASFVPAGEDPMQLAIFQRMARADPRVMSDAHPLQSKFMQKLYKNVPCVDRSSSCRMVVERLFVDEASQTESVMTAFTRFRVLFRCHGTADNHLLVHLHKWKAQGLICLNNDSRCEEALEKFKIATLLSLHVYQNTVGETALMYLNVVVEMLMWCVVCRLHARLAVEAMHYAQHALFMVLSPGLRESAKWLAIGLGRLMAECYYCRNMRVAAIICQGMCIKVFESLDKVGFSCIDAGQMLRACKFAHVDESADMFDKMHKWRSLLEQAVPDLQVTDEWRRNIPLFSEVMCVVEQVKLHPTTKFYSQLNDMMYTYAMRKWRVLLGNAGRMFHREHESARAIDFLAPAFEISKEMQSVPMQLYDVMYIADCMKHAGRVEDACRWYHKFFTLAGGLEKALLTQVLHDKPDWAAAVVLGYAEVCCAMWIDKRLNIDVQEAAQARFHSISGVKSAGYASVKQAMRLVCQLQKSQNLEEEAKTLSSRLRGQLEGLQLKAWQDRAKSPNTQVFRVWKSNANALRLLGEEAGASKAPRKKKNKQKKQKEQKQQQEQQEQKEQPCARTSEAGVLEAGCEECEEAEDIAAVGVPDNAPDNAPDKAPDSGPAQEVPSSGEDHDARDATDECCVCMDAPKHFMFAPCGHRCACEACAKDVMSTTRECPMCRAAASHIFKVFL
jgi:hypothetical protein